MDELGYLRPAGARLGYLDAQMMRAVRVDHRPRHAPGPDRAGRLAGRRGPGVDAGAGGRVLPRHSGRDAEFIDSEIVRYLSAPGQAISYKIGERAWLAGRAAARAARGASFDLKAWHMAALSARLARPGRPGDELARL